MSTAAHPDTRPANPDTEGIEVTHIVCNDCGYHERITALCGYDVTERPDKGPYLGPEPDDCIVCVDLDHTHTCN